jgi:hypothetical protein
LCPPTAPRFPSSSRRTCACRWARLRHSPEHGLDERQRWHLDRGGQRNESLPGWSRRDSHSQRSAKAKVDRGSQFGHVATVPLGNLSRGACGLPQRLLDLCR